MTIFFTSDTHFGHAKIIEYLNRPFATAEEMDEQLAVRWNEIVGEKDTVYHLGDFTLGGWQNAKLSQSAEQLCAARSGKAQTN